MIENDPNLHSETKLRINLETAKINWRELQRQFAQGTLILVHRDLDLVKIAAQFIENEENEIRRLLELGTIRVSDMEDAKRWNQHDAELWAVVAAPWVLVQEVSD